jgi:hypothetical protein
VRFFKITEKIFNRVFYCALKLSVLRVVAGRNIQQRVITMKTRILFTLALILGMHSFSHAVVIESWLFQDNSAVLLENATNSAGTTSFATGLTNTTDGSDYYVVNDSSTGFKVANIQDVSTGQLYMRMDLAGWKLDSDTLNQDWRRVGIHFRNGTAGVNMVAVELSQAGNGTVSFRDGSDDLTGYSSLNADTTTAYSIVLGLDVPTGNYNIQIDDGFGYSVVETGNTTPRDVEVFRFYVSAAGGSDGFGISGDYVNVDSIQLSNDAADWGVAAIPEPGTLALTAFGLLAVIGFARKRR